MKRMLYLFLYLLLQGYASAQGSVTDSLYRFGKLLADAAVEKNTTCKNVNDYISGIQKQSLFALQQSVKKYLATDSQFLAANKSSTCLLKKAVTDFDNQLRKVSALPFVDSLAVFQVLSYVKFKFSGFISVRLNITSSSKDADGIYVSLSSTDPYILPSNVVKDSLPFTVFLKPLAAYNMAVFSAGYEKASSMIYTAERDTSLSVQLLPAHTTSTNIPTQNNDAKNVHGNKDRVWLPWVISGLLFVALIYALLVRNKKGKSSGLAKAKDSDQSIPERSSDQRIREMNDQLQVKDQLIRQYAEEINALKKGNSPVAGTAAQNNQQDKGPYFLSELMMTAGPRKKPMNEKNADVDLGEDVCGFLMIEGEVLAWVLDGTSDFYCLRNPENGREYFSSRLLAQSIARKLKNYFSAGLSENFDKVMTTIFREVRSDWLKNIQALPASERDLLVSNIRSGNFPECATTVLIGKLSLDGNLTVYRSGDSKMLVYGSSDSHKTYVNTTLATKNVKSNDRYFFRLIVAEDGSLDIQQNNPISEIVRKDHINTIIGFSDGIGNETEETLMRDFPLHPDEVRSEIIYQLQGTEDDKSLIIIEIKNKVQSG